MCETVCGTCGHDACQCKKDAVPRKKFKFKITEISVEKRTFRIDVESETSEEDAIAAAKYEFESGELQPESTRVIASVPFISAPQMTRKVML